MERDISHISAQFSFLSSMKEKLGIKTQGSYFLLFQPNSYLTSILRCCQHAMVLGRYNMCEALFGECSPFLSKRTPICLLGVIKPGRS